MGTPVYDLLRFVHVVLAFAAVGANLTYGIWLSRAAGQPAHWEFALRGVKVLDDRIANPAYGLLAVTGVAMILVGRLPWTTPWLLTSIVLYVVLLVVGLFGYTPLLRRQIAALTAGGPTSPQFTALRGPSIAYGIVLAVLVLVIAFLMVTKPTLWGGGG